MDEHQVCLHTIEEDTDQMDPALGSTPSWEPLQDVSKVTCPPSHVRRIPFDDLLSTDPETRELAVQSLRNAMHLSSYCVIGMSQEQREIVSRAVEAQQAFYDLPASYKEEISIGEGRDVGYKDTPNVKEFFQMRLTDIEEMPWPRYPEGYPETITKLWHQLDDIGRLVLSCLAEGLELPSHTFSSFTDPREMPPGEFSHSIMGLYNYYAHNKPTTTCLVHKDMGLITLIPCAAVPGLEVLDNSNFKWVQIEKWASEEQGDLCIIGCQTLERITAGFYPGNIHRVVGTRSRQSMVFKMRAPTHAVIDTHNLGSNKLASLATEGKLYVH